MGKREESRSWAEGLLANHAKYHRKIREVWKDFEGVVEIPPPTDPFPYTIITFDIMMEIDRAKNAEAGEEVYDILPLDGKVRDDVPAMSYMAGRGGVPQALITLPEFGEGGVAKLDLIRIVSSRLCIDMVDLLTSPELLVEWMQYSVDSVWQELFLHFYKCDEDIRICEVDPIGLHVKQENYQTEFVLSACFCPEPNKIIKE